MDVAGSNPVFRSTQHLSVATELRAGRGSSFEYLDPSWTPRARNSSAFVVSHAQSTSRERWICSATIPRHGLARGLPAGPGGGVLEVGEMGDSGLESQRYEETYDKPYAVEDARHGIATHRPRPEAGLSQPRQGHFSQRCGRE